MVLLQAEKITKIFGSSDKPINVLKEVSLEIEPGEMTAIIGASGSGKTTLLQLLGTLDLPTGGELFFREEPLLKKSAGELAVFRNKSVGFIFQFHHLLPDFTALENVMMPGLINGSKKQELRDKATSLLEQVDLGHRVSHKVAELSGGEAQRAALARALIMDPDILLADEPTGNLDSKAGDLVFDLLYDLCRRGNLSTVMVTHNTSLAEKMDHCFLLEDGILNISSKL